MFARCVLLLLLAGPLAAQSFRLTPAQVQAFDTAHQALAVFTPQAARAPFVSLDATLATSTDPAAALVRQQVQGILHLIEINNTAEALLFTHRMGTSVALPPPVATDAAARTQLTAIKTELAVAAPSVAKLELLAQELACHVHAGTAGYRAAMLSGLDSLYILVARGRFANATTEADALLKLLPAPPT
jgi:hypothetical protein